MRTRAAELPEPEERIREKIDRDHEQGRRDGAGTSLGVARDGETDFEGRGYAFFTRSPAQ